MIDRLRSIMARALHKYHEYKKRQSLIEKLLPSTIIVCEQVDHAESLLKQQQRHSQENLSVQQRLEEAETERSHLERELTSARERLERTTGRMMAQRYVHTLGQMFLNPRLGHRCSNLYTNTGLK